MYFSLAGTNVLYVYMIETGSFMILVALETSSSDVDIVDLHCFLVVRDRLGAFS